MGHVVSSSMKEAQREMQAEMQEKQLNMMIKTQERMKRAQIAQMVAMAREQFYWVGGLYSLLITGASTFAFKNRHLPPAVGVPIIVGGTFLAYQYDLCWGTKLERVSKMADELALEDRWFNPSMPSPADVDRLLHPPTPIKKSSL